MLLATLKMAVERKFLEKHALHSLMLAAALATHAIHRHSTQGNESGSSESLQAFHSKLSPSEVEIPSQSSNAVYITDWQENLLNIHEENKKERNRKKNRRKFKLFPKLKCFTIDYLPSKMKTNS